MENEYPQPSNLPKTNIPLLNCNSKGRFFLGILSEVCHKSFLLPSVASINALLHTSLNLEVKPSQLFLFIGQLVQNSLLPFTVFEVFIPLICQIPFNNSLMFLYPYDTSGILRAVTSR